MNHSKKNLKLASLRTLNGDTQESLAKYLGITKQAYNHKENGGRTLRIEEIKAIKERYNLTAEEMYEVFF